MNFILAGLCLVLGVAIGFLVALVRLRAIDSDIRELVDNHLPSDQVCKAAERLIDRKLGDYPGCRHDRQVVVFDWCRLVELLAGFAAARK